MYVLLFWEVVHLFVFSGLYRAYGVLSTVLRIEQPASSTRSPAGQRYLPPPTASIATIQHSTT